MLLDGLYAVFFSAQGFCPYIDVAKPRPERVELSSTRRDARLNRWTVHYGTTSQ